MENDSATASLSPLGNFSSFPLRPVVAVSTDTDLQILHLTSI